MYEYYKPLADVPHPEVHKTQARRGHTLQCLRPRRLLHAEGMTVVAKVDPDLLHTQIFVALHFTTQVGVRHFIEAVRVLKLCRKSHRCTKS